FYACLALSAQSQKDYTKVDSLIYAIPQKSTSSTATIAAYINNNWSEEADKARAAYVWVATNIEYDVANMYAPGSYEEEIELVEEALDTRRGICGHFAETFHSIARQLGLKSYSITGYTKQTGRIDDLAHAWCVARIDSSWYIFDPTWGSGTLVADRFISRLNNDFFMMTPQKAIISHMPFDPLWQFLNYPMTSTEFYEDDFEIDHSKSFFNYIDTLKMYEQQSETERLAASTNRIKENGISNRLISNRLQYNQQVLEYHRKQGIIDQYNEAVNAYNEGIYALNDFINYRNRKFEPKKTEAEIRQMITQIDHPLEVAKSKLESIESPNSVLDDAAIKLNEAVKKAIIEKAIHQAFVDKYFNTKKILRKSLFYKYTWMGIPLN
ncbi:MAG: transglutaminase domain-containing protein, partial [Bacteroidota bacterium]